MIDFRRQIVQKASESWPGCGAGHECYLWNSGMNDEATAHQAGFQRRDENGSW